MRGFTLIEMIVFIVIVGVALAGVLTVLNVAVKSSADPIQPKQAMLIAESMLEEIQLKPYCDPDTVVVGTPATCGVHTTEASRALYDDILDYDGYATTGVYSLDNLVTPVAGLENYNVSVSVGAEATIQGAPARLITVTVTVGVGGNSYSLSSYRFNYD
jgi:MSHA pilin protein MshD